MTNIITKGSLIQSIPPWSVIQNRWSSRCKYKYIYEWTMHEHTWWSTGQAILCSLNNRDKKSFLAQTQNMIFHENTSCLISSPNPKLIKTWTAGNKIAIGCIIFCFLNSHFIEWSTCARQEIVSLLSGNWKKSRIHCEIPRNWLPT